LRLSNVAETGLTSFRTLSFEWRQGVVASEILVDSQKCRILQPNFRILDQSYKARGLSETINLGHAELYNIAERGLKLNGNEVHA
jgi:hypothetical protein